MAGRRVLAVASLGAVGAVAAGYALWRLRPWELHWGASPEEVAAVMPGDEIVARPHLAVTRAIDIAAPRALVWPWLVQMGYGRAGWYSYDHVDNRGHPSAENIIADLQHLEVGDLVPTGPGSGLIVEALDPERLLLLSARRPDGTASVALRLSDRDDGGTRLVIRLRVRVRPTARGMGVRALMEIADFAMMRRMLLGIKRRAETAAADQSLRFDITDAPQA